MKVQNRSWLMEPAKHSKVRPVSVGLPREHVKDLSPERMISEYEGPGCPVLIDGIADNWPATKKWGIHELSQGPYRNCRLKCGEDDDGYSIKLKMKYFLDYLLIQKDDSPLYLFDSGFDDNSVAKELLKDYEVPLFLS